MSNKAPVICLDANVLIYFLSGHPIFGPKARMAVEDAQAHRIGAVTSTFALVETLYLHDRHVGHSDHDQEIIEAFFGSPWLVLRSLDRLIGTDANRLVKEYQVNGKFAARDAVYFATAQRSGASHLFTFDQDFIKAYEDNIPGIVLCEPFSQDRQVKWL